MVRRMWDEALASVTAMRDRVRRLIRPAGPGRTSVPANTVSTRDDTNGPIFGDGPPGRP